MTSVSINNRFPNMSHRLAFVPMLAYRQSIPSIASPRHVLKSRKVAYRPAKFLFSPTRMSAAVFKTGDSCSEADLEQFAENVRGEWSGYECTFDVTTAEAQAIPESYVPEQFTEWGLQPRGFETNHSMIVRGTRLFRKFFRILPSVSSFSDHVDLEEDFTISDISEEKGTHIFPDGSFSSGPEVVPVEKKSYFDKWPKVDVYLHDPRPDLKEAIHVHFCFDFEKRELVKELRVVIEKYSCIYCDGADIEGSSGYVEGWVDEAMCSADRLAGTWTITGGSGDADTVERPSGGPPSVPGKQLYLPRGIDVSILENSNGDIITQVGWLVDDETRIVIQRKFGKDGTVLLSERSVERRV